MSSSHSDITLLINSLGEGGAQRVVVTLAKEFLKEGKTVTLLSLAKNDLYELPSEVKRVYFTDKSHDSMLLIPYYAWKLKNYIKDNRVPVVQSFLFRANYVNILSKILGSNQIVQVSNRSVVSRFLVEGISGKINLLLIKLLYRQADLIMYVSQRMKLDFHEQFNIRKDEVVIYNPYDIERIVSDADKQVNNFIFRKDRRYLVTVGRLISFKRFQDVIEVLKDLPDDVELLLLGDGKEREKLENLSLKYGLENRVHFMGQVKNPYQYISRSDIFVSTSSVEGFPNVLLESMICKTPIVSSDCLSGPREILSPSTDSSKQLTEGLEKSEYGVLYAVGDVDALRNSIKLLLEEKELKEKYIEKASKRAELFSVEKIAQQYEVLFDK
jgi:N-acetylgalactosamine-N,N'-diacetylbacillosaminyl-diphospho-undecaprenol 4-alpha-N-acetylgalactosaminyltransferase